MGLKNTENTIEAEKKSQILLTKIPQVTTFFSLSRKPNESLTLENIGDNDPVIAETSVIEEADPVADPVSHCLVEYRKIILHVM